MKQCLLLTLIFTSGSLFAQVESDRALLFTGAHDSLRQIRNLSGPIDSTNAVNANDLQSNTLIYANASGVDSLTFNLTPGLTTYHEGMIVMFKPSSVNEGPVKISINGLPYKDLLYNSGGQVAGGTLNPSRITTAVYEGNAFRILDRNNGDCPPGFIPVTREYCIEPVERAALLSDPAMQACYSMNARLCTWGEWYYACQKSSLGMQNMTDNYEWIDDSSNHANTHSVVGQNSCVANFTITIPDNVIPYNYRCCYSR